MKNYTIEKVKLGDENTLAFIQTESWKYAFKDILSAEILEKCTNLKKARIMYCKLIENQKGNGYILKIEGEPHCIAWWDVSRSEDMNGYAELICIHSLKENCGKGYGSKMMEKVLDDMKTAGYSKVMLWVFEENYRARKFYERHGFNTKMKIKPRVCPIEICYEKNL